MAGLNLTVTVELQPSLPTTTYITALNVPVHGEKLFADHHAHWR